MGVEAEEVGAEEDLDVGVDMASAVEVRCRGDRKGALTEVRRRLLGSRSSIFAVRDKRDRDAPRSTRL